LTKNKQTNKKKQQQQQQQQRRSSREANRLLAASSREHTSISENTIAITQFVSVALTQNAMRRLISRLRKTNNHMMP
jgi:hypothetical protein